MNVQKTRPRGKQTAKKGLKRAPFVLLRGLNKK